MTDMHERKKFIKTDIKSAGKYPALFMIIRCSVADTQSSHTNSGRSAQN